MSKTPKWKGRYRVIDDLVVSDPDDPFPEVAPEVQDAGDRMAEEAAKEWEVNRMEHKVLNSLRQARNIDGPEARIAYLRSRLNDLLKEGGMSDAVRAEDIEESPGAPSEAEPEAGK